MEEIVLTNQQAIIFKNTRSQYLGWIEMLIICSDLIDFLVNHRFEQFFECCSVFRNFDIARVISQKLKFEKILNNAIQLGLLGMLEFALILLHINLTQLDLIAPVERAIPVFLRYLQNLNFLKTEKNTFYLSYIQKLLEVIKDRCTATLYKYRESFHEGASAINSYLDPNYVSRPLSYKQHISIDQIHKSALGSTLNPFSNPTIQQPSEGGLGPYEQKMREELNSHRISLEEDDPNTMDAELQRRIVRIGRPLSGTFQDHKCFTEIHAKLYSKEYLEFTEAHASVRGFVERILQHLYTSQ